MFMALNSLDSLVLYQKIFRTLYTDRMCASPSYRKVRRNVIEHSRPQSRTLFVATFKHAMTL